MTAQPRPGWAGLPRRIRVGWRRLEVAALDPVTANSACGRTQLDGGHIGIDPALRPEVMVETVLHEVMHGIVAVWVGTPTGEHEETEIDAMAAGLTALMQDNPGLVRWALATLEEG